MGRRLRTLGAAAGIYAVLGLPLLVFGLVAFAGALFVILIPLMAGSAPSGGGIAAFIGIIGIAMLVLVPLGIVLGVLQMLAVRYAMLEDRSWSASISAGWELLKARFKDVALMWLLLVAVSIGYGIALVIPILLFAFPLVLLALSKLWVPMALVILVMTVAARGGGRRLQHLPLGRVDGLLAPGHRSRAREAAPVADAGSWRLASCAQLPWLPAAVPRAAAARRTRSRTPRSITVQYPPQAPASPPAGTAGRTAHSGPANRGAAPPVAPPSAPVESGSADEFGPHEGS